MGGFLSGSSPNSKLGEEEEVKISTVPLLWLTSNLIIHKTKKQNCFAFVVALHANQHADGKPNMPIQLALKMLACLGWHVGWKNTSLICQPKHANRNMAEHAPNMKKLWKYLLYTQTQNFECVCVCWCAGLFQLPTWFFVDGVQIFSSLSRLFFFFFLAFCVWVSLFFFSLHIPSSAFVETFCSIFCVCSDR